MLELFVTSIMALAILGFMLKKAIEFVFKIAVLGIGVLILLFVFGLALF